MNMIYDVTAFGITPDADALQTQAIQKVLDLCENGGGTVVCTGTPEEGAECEKSYTGMFLKKILAEKG